jgi:hypothetical protein
MEPGQSPKLAWAREIFSIAQSGLTYSKNEFDLDRYLRLQGIAAEMIASQSELTKEAVLDSFRCKLDMPLQKSMCAAQ